MQLSADLLNKTRCSLKRDSSRLGIISGFQHVLDLNGYREKVDDIGRVCVNGRFHFWKDMPFLISVGVKFVQTVLMVLMHV